MPNDARNTFRPSLFDRGAAKFSEVFDTSPQEFADSVGAMAPGFGHLILEMEFGEIYHRPGLDAKTRELVIIASCAALGATGLGAVKMHIPAALRAGATRSEIVETLVQVSMAAGLPASLGALQAANEIFAALETEAAPLASPPL